MSASLRIFQWLEYYMQSFDRGKTLEAIQKEFRVMAGMEKFAAFANMLEQMTNIKNSEEGCIKI